MDDDQSNRNDFHSKNKNRLSHRAEENIYSEINSER
jgi:hypothetical protein